MTTLHLNETRFKAIATRFREDATRRGFTTSHLSALQIMAQAIFGKPYEEIKPLLQDTATPEPATSIAGSDIVTILHYGSEKLLMRNSEYITGNYPGTDMAIPDQAFNEQAHMLANQLGTTLREVSLPSILAPGYETDDIIALAERMGDLQSTPSIFSCFEQANIILLNGGFTVCGLNGDYVNELEAVAENAEDDSEIDNCCIWMPEYTEGFALYEFYVSFDQLCQATSDDGGKTWHIPYDDTTLFLSLL